MTESTTTMPIMILISSVIVRTGPVSNTKSSSLDFIVDSEAFGVFKVVLGILVEATDVDPSIDGHISDTQEKKLLRYEYQLSSSKLFNRNFHRYDP